MKERIVKGIKNHKMIISNTFFLSIVQLINMVVPLIALPYVIKTIGFSNWGIIAFAQSVVAYFFIIINYGLDVSAVKDVSQNRDNPQKLSEIVSSVLLIKSGLFVISFVLFSFLMLVFPLFEENRLLYFIVFAGSLSEILFPLWYFQGIERMAIITVIRFIAVGFYLSTLFIVVRNATDMIFVPMLQVGGVILSAVVGLLLLLYKENIKLIKPRKTLLKKVFNESTPFFLSRVSIVINGNIATTLSGVFLGFTEVATFDLVRKIINFALVPFQMLNQAIYPHNANKRDVGFVKKFFSLLFVLVLFASILIYFLAPMVIDFFAKEPLPEAIKILRVFIIFFVFDVFALFLGSPVLIAFGFQKPFNMSVYLSTVALLICYGIFFVTNSFSLLNFTIALIVTSVVLAIYRFYYCRRYKLL